MITDYYRKMIIADYYRWVKMMANGDYSWWLHIITNITDRYIGWLQISEDDDNMRLHKIIDAYNYILWIWEQMFKDCECRWIQKIAGDDYRLLHMMILDINRWLQTI